MDHNDPCACGHLRRHHERVALTGRCAALACACSVFTDPDTAQRKRRNRRGERVANEKNRRLQVLRNHIRNLILQMQRQGDVIPGADVARQLTDRVESFVLRSLATDCDPDQLLAELAKALAEPVRIGPSQLAPTPFPRGVAKDVLDEIVEAAHHARDTLFQVAA